MGDVTCLVERICSVGGGLEARNKGIIGGLLSRCSLSNDGSRLCVRDCFFQIRLGLSRMMDNR
jgi:hypothetical protein